MNGTNTASDLFAHYSAAKSHVIERGFLPELEWIEGLQQHQYTEQDFMRETAWVILCSGFRESIVRAKFSYLSLCFCDWESAADIAENKDCCIVLAEKAIRHRRKLEAIVEIACEVSTSGFSQIRYEIELCPIERLLQFPYIGPITSYHLAKNLGFQFAKDDRHLRRLVTRLDFPVPKIYAPQSLKPPGTRFP